MLNINLTGKLAVVTGAAGQLGRVIARTLADCGADVVIHYNTSQAKAEEVADQVRALGRRSMTVRADVGDLDSVLAMRDAIGAELGSPHIIVNNAVAQYEWVSVLEQGVEDYESQFRTCVLQNVNMAKAFVPAMIERGWGRVIALSTECAMQCVPGQSAYVSGKRGQDGVLRVLAREVGPHGVTVNQVAPGWTISERYRESGQEVVPEYSDNVPLRRRGQDTEIAYAVAFLASDLAAFITGLYLPVTGGNVMPTI